MDKQQELFPVANPSSNSTAAIRTWKGLGGGTRANQSGETVEALCANLLEQRGYVVQRQAVLGKNIYGGDLRADLWLPEVPLVVEVKWQDARGSTDEKFPYLVENVRVAYPAPVLLIVDGGGVRSGALTWLKGQVDGRRLLGVLSIEEFVSWVLRSA